MLYRLLRPLLFRLDAERAHELVCAWLQAAGNAALVRAALAAAYRFDHPALELSVGGLWFRNPVGLAAGFDKQARLMGPMARLGFGHVEIGTVTPRAQPGNPPPRLFRLPEDAAIINRLGFNSPGMRVVAPRLRAARPYGVILGANIGKNRDTPLERAVEDYVAAFVALAPRADYVAVNVSSPNTPGLRELQRQATLAELLAALNAANRTLRRPIWLKISPDERPDQLERIARTVLEARLTGIIATNTTVSRPELHSAVHEQGGLSGRPLAPLALAAIRRLHTITAGCLPLIAAGGVSSAADAYERICAGASLVQIYTGLVYHGPALPGTICRGLVRLLARDGYVSVSEAVGATR